MTTMKLAGPEIKPENFDTIVRTILETKTIHLVVSTQQRSGIKGKCNEYDWLNIGSDEQNIRKHLEALYFLGFTRITDGAW